MSPSRRGALALTPLLVFLLVYLVTSLAVGDFYKVPVSAAFLIASIYAICITSNAAGATANNAAGATASKAAGAAASNAAGAAASKATEATASNAAGAAAGTWGGKLPLRERIAIFSEGAGDKNVLLMIAGRRLRQHGQSHRLHRCHGEPHPVHPACQVPLRRAVPGRLLHFPVHRHQRGHSRSPGSPRSRIGRRHRHEPPPDNGHHRRRCLLRRQSLVHLGHHHRSHPVTRLHDDR